jgi:ankyrin repeat protein
MKRWKFTVIVALVAVFVFRFSHAANPIQDRERKLAQELEVPPKDALQIQRKWDELRKAFAEAMLGLALREPEKKVLEQLDALFQKGATLDMYNDETLEPAVLSRAKLVTKLLLDKGADPDGFRRDSKPLKIATKHGDQEIISLLRQNGAKPLKPADAAQLRLTFAASIGDLKTVRQQLSKGADINSRDNLDDTTPLIEAVSWGRLETVKLLLSLHADPNQSGHVTAIDYLAPNPLHSRSTCTPLHAATLHGGYPEIIKLLLKAGAPVSSTNCYKNLTPLHVAAKFQSASAASVLLKEGAKVMAKDSDGKTPLDYAESGPVIKLLKAYGAREAQ